MRSESNFFGLRQARQLGGASLLAMVAVTGAVPAALAQERYFYRDPYFAGYPSPPPRLDAQRPEPRRIAPRQPQKPAVKAADHKGKEAPPPAGPHMLIVSVKSQHISFYANGKLVSQSPVSTGKATNPTPHGVFSVIQRNRHHRSNIYSGAPMPYMQRLTWSGIALHEGKLPGYPASHGCIRLPEQYANYLWRTLRMNTRVIVAREDVVPVDVAHTLLFQPKPAAATVETVPELRKTLDTTGSVLVRTASASVVATDGAGERSAETSPAMRDLSISVEHLHTKGNIETAIPAPAAMPTRPELAGQEPAGQESAAQEPTKDGDAPEATASIYPKPADIPEPILTSFAQSLEAKQKRTVPTGNLTVFISKKEKRLYVRQHFVPLFSAPVSFKDEKGNFGTHVFTALAKDGTDKELRWTAVTMPAELPHVEKVKTRVELDRRGRPIEVPVKPHGKAPEPISSLSATAVLDRIEIAPEVIERISEYVAAGSSLIVSDHGLGHETGNYTDFIVVTR